MRKVSEKLVKETKAMIRLYLFLRHDCGLKEADEMSARELRSICRSFSGQEKD